VANFLHESQNSNSLKNIFINGFLHCGAAAEFAVTAAGQDIINTRWEDSKNIYASIGEIGEQQNLGLQEFIADQL
jgi:hypothetical protein